MQKYVNIDPMNQIEITIEAQPGTGFPKRYFCNKTNNKIKNEIIKKKVPKKKVA